MSIPKCRECDCHWGFPISDYSQKNEHYCHYHLMCGHFGKTEPVMKIWQTGFQGDSGKKITGKEFKTSPNWCPKRPPK